MVAYRVGALLTFGMSCVGATNQHGWFPRAAGRNRGTTRGFSEEQYRTILHWQESLNLQQWICKLLKDMGKLQQPVRNHMPGTLIPDKRISVGPQENIHRNKEV